MLKYLIVLAACSLQGGETAACGNTYFGENKPKDKDNDIDTNPDTGYIMSETNYIIDCCGVVDGWEAFFDNIASSRTAYFQVWRPVSGDTYQLVGENAWTVDTRGEHSIAIPANERITIKSGDKFGWWVSGNDVITYKKGGGEEDNNWIMTNMPDVAPGSSHDWSAKAVQHDRSYAVRMNVISNSAPRFTNLPTFELITNAVTSGTSVLTVTVDDDNPDDVSELSVTMATNSLFSFDTSTLIVRTSGSYETVATTSLLLQFEVSDQCSNTATSSLTVSIQNPAPVIQDLPASATISEEETTEMLLHTFSATDTIGTPTCTLASSVPASYPFTVKLKPSSTDYGVYSLSNPGFDHDTLDQYGLTVACTDGHSTATGSVTISLLENPPPVIQSLPAAATINETVTVETLLHAINVTDTRGTPTCSMASSVPASYPFQVRVIPDSTDYGIYSMSSPGFNYNSKNYFDLTINCADTKTTVSGSFSVSLRKNSAPVFINLQNSTSISTTTATLGSNVFTVISYDAESDSLIYNMTCDPTPCPFKIFNSGDIQVSTDLTGHTVVGYDLYIYVADPRNLVGPDVLTVTMADINDPVVISNLPIPSSMSVAENTPTGTPIYTVSYSDVDTSQSHTFTMTSSPGTGLTYFGIDSTTGVVSTSGTVTNYEHLLSLSTTTFTLTITINDPVTSDSKDLVIDVINANEAPTFGQISYSLSTTESVSNTIIGTPSFGVTDPDNGDSHTLSMNCGANTAYFHMDPATGQVKFLSNYDLDTGSLATTVVCTVTATDTGSLTATASLTILIDDKNDNTPVFSPTAYSFYISYYSAVGTSVGTVTATDADAGSFGSFTYSINQTALGVEHFVVDNSGMITVKVTPKGSVMGYATSVTVFVMATDIGGLSSSAPVVIVISDTTTTSTTTTTDRYRTFIEDNRNVAWLVACVVLLVIIVGTLLWIIYTCRGDKGCSQFIRKWCGKRAPRHPRIRNRRQSYEVYHVTESYNRQHAPSHNATPRQYPVPQRHPQRLISHSVRNPPPPVGNQHWRSGV